MALGLASSGVHANGFSLVRVDPLTQRSLDLRQPFPGTAQTLGDVLLTPTTIDSPRCMTWVTPAPCTRRLTSPAAAFPTTLAAPLPPELAVEVDLDSWQLPGVFTWLREAGVDDDEMLGTFNCGVGMIVMPAG